MNRPTTYFPVRSSKEVLHKVWFKTLHSGSLLLRIASICRLLYLARSFSSRRNFAGAGSLWAVSGWSKYLRWRPQTPYQSNIPSEGFKQSRDKGVKFFSQKASKMVASNKYTAPKEDDVISNVMVPTDNALNPAHHREIDLRQMDEQDIKLLKKMVSYLKNENINESYHLIIFANRHLIFTVRPIHVLFHSRSASGIRQAQRRWLFWHCISKSCWFSSPKPVPTIARTRKGGCKQGVSEDMHFFRMPSRCTFGRTGAGDVWPITGSSMTILYRHLEGAGTYPPIQWKWFMIKMRQ